MHIEHGSMISLIPIMIMHAYGGTPLNLHSSIRMLILWKTVASYYNSLLYEIYFNNVANTLHNTVTYYFMLHRAIYISLEE